MEPKELEEIREHLRERRDKLAGQLPSLKEAVKPIPPDDALGRLTRLDAIQSQQISRDTLQQAQARLAALEFALGRIDNRVSDFVPSATAPAPPAGCAPCRARPATSIAPDPRPPPFQLPQPRPPLSLSRRERGPRFNALFCCQSKPISLEIANGGQN